MSLPRLNKPIGVLGLQGDFEAHRRALEQVQAAARVIRHPWELDEVEGLVLPGGESTTLLRLMQDVGFLEPLRRFHSSGAPIFGTCAGAILLAARVIHPEQLSLGLIDIEVERNAYGRQRESFETGQGSLDTSFDAGAAGERSAGPEVMDLVLIRAPRIRRCGSQVQILVRHGEEPVLVRQKNVLAGTFHPELGRDRRVHLYFAEMARGAALAA